MEKNFVQSNENPAARAFTAQSSLFDNMYGNDPIVIYKRARVRTHIEKFISPKSNILELNAGTGEDAIYFAAKGHTVHATDLSTGMLQILSDKVKKNENGNLISWEQCSFTELGSLQNKGPYDLIFSNFAGLNCTGNLDQVLQSFDTLLKPGGMITLAILPGFCLWETLLFLRGDFKTAFRRLFAKKGTPATVEGNAFTCWYYQPEYIIKHLGEKYTCMDLEGLCTLVPPNYFTAFPKRFPKLFSYLINMENKYSRSWPWKKTGDYYIISMKKQ